MINPKIIKICFKKTFLIFKTLFKIIKKIPNNMKLDERHIHYLLLKITENPNQSIPYYIKKLKQQTYLHTINYYVDKKN